MSIKDSGLIDVGYPIYGAKFVNNRTIIVTGGGGEGNNGIPNKITAIKCSFKVSDKNKRLQKFREIVLPKNEDSPMCLDIAKDSADNEDFSIFVGCNQSTQLLKSMNINNNLRKYVFTSEEHLRFVDAAQLEEGINGEGVGEYPKIVCLSSHNSVGCLMTSRNPSAIYIFNPDLLELNFKFKPEEEVDIVDFHLSPDDDGKTLCYITASSIQTISTVTGNSISSSKAASNKALAQYNLLKIRFIDDSNIIVAASLKNGKGVSIFQYSIPDKKILKQRDISSKIKGITAIDISLPQGLVALAGNDTSVTVLRLSDFKTIKTFAKLHSFAITKVAFSPSGSKLASVSAANTLHVMKIPANYSRGKSIIGTLVHYIFMAVLACLVAIFLQKLYENGQLEQFYELSSHYGQVGFKLANEYGFAGYQFVKEKIRGENIDGDDTTKKYFTMDEWDENEYPLSSVASAATNFVESFSAETTEIASTIVQPNPSSISIDDIDVRSVTKDIDEITKHKDMNTESFFNDTNNYIEKSTIINAPNISTSNIVEPMVAGTTELEAAKTDLISEEKETRAISNSGTKSTSLLTEVSDEEFISDVVQDMEDKEDIEIVTDNVIENEGNETEPTAGVETDAEDDLENEAVAADSDKEEEIDDSDKGEEIDDSDVSVDEEPMNPETNDLDIRDEIIDQEISDDTVTDDETLYEEDNEEFHTVDDDDGNEIDVDEDNSMKNDATESLDSAETLEQDQIARGTESSDLGEDIFVNEPIFEANEDDIENLTPDQIHDESDEDSLIIDNYIEDTADKIDDSRPADSPIMENNTEKENELVVDDSRPANLPHADVVNESDFKPDTKRTSDSDIDSTFEQNEDVKTQTSSKSSSSKYDVGLSEVGSESSTSISSTSISENFAVTKIFTSSSTKPSSAEPSTTEHLNTGSSNTGSSNTGSSNTGSSNTGSSTSKPSTNKTSTGKSSTDKTSADRTSTDKTSTAKPASIKHSAKPVTSKLSSTVRLASKASSKRLSNKNLNMTKKATLTKITTQANTKTASIESPQKTILKTKGSSSISSAQPNIKSATKNSSKKTRIPKKSLSKRLTKSRTVKPKPTSQLHDEL